MAKAKKTKGLTNSVLQTVSKKTGKKITEKDIRRLASKVNADTLKNEKELRSLIRQVSKLVNVPVSESLMNSIVDTVKNTGPSGLQQLVSMMTPKK